MQVITEATAKSILTITASLAEHFEIATVEKTLSKTKSIACYLLVNHQTVKFLGRFLSKNT